MLRLRKRDAGTTNHNETLQELNERAASCTPYLESADAAPLPISTNEELQLRGFDAVRDLGAHHQKLLQYDSILKLVAEEIDRPSGAIGISKDVVARTQVLGQLAIQCVHFMAERPELTQDLAPGFVVLTDQIETSISDLQSQLAHTSARQNLISELTELFVRISNGDIDHAPRWREIAVEVIESVDQHWYPQLGFTSTQHPVIWQAEHAANLAHVVAYLAAADSEWRGQRESLVTAALLQNIGMLRVSPNVLHSTGEIGPRELHEIRRHTSSLGPFLSQIPGIDPESAKAAVCHHERLDGSGYPHGMNGTMITPATRLLSVADSFVGRLGYRTHRPPQTAKQAMMEILEEAELGKLDQDWAVALLKISFFPVGSKVELATGHIAEVIAPQDPGVHPNLAALPIVKLLTDAEGAAVSSHPVRNLALRPDCRITRVISDAA